MFFVYILMVFSLSAHATDSCVASLTTSSGIETATRLSHKVAAQTEMELEKAGVTSKRGYAILIGSMVGSAALATYLGTHLPEDLKFASIFVSQVSTLGVYVLGAPIWEPLSSRFRKWAFGVSKDPFVSGQDQQQQLEMLWQRTQESYSLNAQMSRNVISQFILTVRQNFYEARRAFVGDDLEYCADQIAEAAFRLRILFRDVAPNDRSVAAAVNSAFTNHIQITPEFVAMVCAKARALDVDFDSVKTQKHYQITFQTWLYSTATCSGAGTI